MPQIILNGNEREIADSTTLSNLLDELGIPIAGTAVAVNGTIVSRENHETHIVEFGDKVDVIRAIGGG
ncbi:MAG: sulfur carrier protein ThiS [Pseudomonadota bacterium]